ncbi:MAG: hypothetical protein AAF403_04715, partial [Pseudomonadota bacterium]
MSNPPPIDFKKARHRHNLKILAIIVLLGLSLGALIAFFLLIDQQTLSSSISSKPKASENEIFEDTHSFGEEVTQSSNTQNSVSQNFLPETAFLNQSDTKNITSDQQRLGNALTGDEQDNIAIDQKITSDENRLNFDRIHQNFKQLLADIEDNFDLQQWLTKNHHIAEAHKNIEDALSLKKEKQEVEASQKLQISLEQLEQKIDDWNQSFDRFMDLATQFYNEKNEAAALENIQKAIDLKPSSRQASILKERIKRLSQIKQLEHDIEQARQNNDLNLQYDLLKQLIVLDKT